MDFHRSPSSTEESLLHECRRVTTCPTNVTVYYRPSFRGPLPLPFPLSLCGQKRGSTTRGQTVGAKGEYDTTLTNKNNCRSWRRTL